MRPPATPEELDDHETDVLAGFVLARAWAGLADSTIRHDTNHLELIRDWLNRPLWEMAAADADAYFGKALRDANPATRTGCAAALAVFFEFLELRHKVELQNLTGRVVECPLDEMSRPRTSVEPRLLVPPTGVEIETQFAGKSFLPTPGPGQQPDTIHVHRPHLEDAWTSGQKRAADRWKGLTR